MTTSKRQISENGKGELIFSQLVSPANHSALLESEQERMITVTSGQRLFVQYGRYSQLGSLVKTLLESSAWYSQAMRLKWDVQTIYSSRITYTERSKNPHSRSSAKTLSVRDMQSNRLLFRLVPSVRHTGETECGLLPTVQTQGLKICNENGKPEFLNPLLLPTPTAIDKGSGRMNKSRSLNSSERPTLALAARKKLLPTPNATEGVKYTKRYNPKSQMGTSLTAMAINGMLETKTDHKIDGRISHLNPLYVADMMGFPSMWTILPFLSQNGGKRQSKPWETLGYHR